MYLEAKLAMKECTNTKRQWLWFIALWLGGFGSVLLLSTIIKLIMKVA